MARKRFLRVYLDEDVKVLDIGDMETWDGADLARLRDSFVRMNGAEKLQSIGVDMSHVKAIPSGYFGMLYDWYELGLEIRLYSPQPNVRQMMWFSQFFESVSGDCYMLCPRAAVLPHEEPLATAAGE
jgi:hypothetical protein